MSIRKVTIIGCGSIGASFAALFLAHGLSVTAYDIDPKAEGFFRALVREALPTLSQLGQLEEGGEAVSADSIFSTTDLKEALKDADFIQENGPERLDFKQKLFSEIAKEISPDIIIATSSSGLTCSSIQEGMAEGSHPERCVVGHPFNPPHIIPLVEVVGGSMTSEATISRTLSFYAYVGRKPIQVRKEVIGHVANRLQAALAREILHLVSEDVCTVGDIDDAMMYGPGSTVGYHGTKCIVASCWRARRHQAYERASLWTDDDLVCEYEDLSKQRDEELIRLLKVRSEWDGYAESQKGR